MSQHQPRETVSPGTSLEMSREVLVLVPNFSLFLEVTDARVRQILV